MEFIVWLVIWSMVSYLYAKDTKEKCPGIDINPINYVFGAVFIGAFFCITYCWYKKRKYLEKKMVTINN